MTTNKILVVLALSSLPFASQAFAKKAASIELVTTFDYPSAVSTIPTGINEEGDIVGSYSDSSGTVRGFVRYKDGSFGTPIVHPDDNANITRAVGVNEHDVIVGHYAHKDDPAGPAIFHGWIQTKGVFKTFDVPGAVFTAPYGVNDPGDLTGAYMPAGQPIIEGFLKRKEKNKPLETFAFPNAQVTIPLGVNEHREIVGDYLEDSSGQVHGFLRGEKGDMCSIEVPGAVVTEAVGINERRLISGSYQDGAGYHGYVKCGSKFVSYDVPGAVLTIINGISEDGFVVGRYQTVTGGSSHGFEAVARCEGYDDTDNRCEH